MVKQAEALLESLLRSGPVEFQKIQAALAREGISERTARAAKARLGIISVKTGGKGKGWAWSLPGGGLQPLNLAAFETELIRADLLAWKARRLAEAGDLAGAENVRNEHAAIFEQLETRIHQPARAGNTSRRDLE